jgi:PAS domain S-box-containing protein
MVRALRRRAAWVLAVVVAIGVTGHVIVATELNHERGQAGLVNRMGWQRTLSARVAVAELQAIATRDDATRARWLALADTSMAALVRSDSVLHAGGLQSTRALRILDRAEGQQRAMLATAREARALIGAGDTGHARRAVESYVTQQGAFVARIDSAVGVLAADTEMHGRRALYLSAIVTIVSLGAFGVLIRLRVMPAMTALADGYEALEVTRRELVARHRDLSERHRALEERALRQEAEHEERVAALERAHAARVVEQEREFERTLDASEARVEAIVQGAGIVIIGLRPDGHAYVWNEAAARLYGVTAEEAMGVDYVERFVVPEARDAVRADIARVLAGTPTRDFENEIVPVDGVRRRLLWNVTRVTAADGTPIGVVAMGVDITERSVADERFRVLFQASSDAHLLFDESGIIDCNEAAVRMLRAPDKTALLGLHPSTLSPERQPCGNLSADLALEMDGAARRHGHHRFDWMHRRLDGTEIPVEVSLTQVVLRGKATLLVVWHDLTPRRAYEAALEAARDQADAANRTKSRFLASMSHELRTPLNSIIGFTKQVLRNRHGTLHASEVTYLERVHFNGTNLLGLINDLLDLTKIEAGKLELDIGPVDVGTLVTETVAGLEGQPRRPGVALVTEVPEGLVLAESDAQKLRQVLVNLVGNAIKFTHAGSVTVRVEAGVDGTPSAIVVRDTGIGIPADRIEAIFTAFEQAERTTARDYGGTGLGLAITRSLCELLGLRLEVTSVVGEGTEFRVAFPVVRGQLSRAGAWSVAA